MIKRDLVIIGGGSAGMAAAIEAKKNGIDDVYGWLRTYCRDLYRYCLQKQWTSYIREGKSLTKKILIWDMVSLSEGFDFSKYQIIKY